MPNFVSQIATLNYASVRKAYFTDVFLVAFDRVSRIVTPIEKTYRVAGRTLRLRFYGDAFVERLGRALAHHEVAAADTADLVVSLWDSTRVAAFASPWSDLAYRFDAETDARQENADGFKGAYLGGEESLSFYDSESKVAHFWTRDAAELPPWVSAAPIRTILHWFLSDRNMNLVHGAVVGTGTASALLTAKGGSGKSTTALSCLLAGMEYLGDDYVAVQSGETVVTHSLYASAKVSPDRVPAFDAVRSHVWDNEGEKSIVFLSESFPKQLPASAPLSAVLIPTIAHLERTEIVPAGKMETLLALVPTTLMQLPLAGTDTVARLREIVARVPCFSLRLGRDSREAALAIKGFLDRLC